MICSNLLHGFDIILTLKLHRRTRLRLVLLYAVWEFEWHHTHAINMNRCTDTYTLSLWLLLQCCDIRHNFFAAVARCITKHLFSYSKRVSTVKPSQEDAFFVRLWNIFFEIVAPFQIPKHFWKYQTMFSKKIQLESTTLNKSLVYSNFY